MYIKMYVIPGSHAYMKANQSYLLILKVGQLDEHL